MPALRTRLIRLAAAKPDLRKDLLPLLKSAALSPSVSRKILRLDRPPTNGLFPSEIRKHNLDSSAGNIRLTKPVSTSAAALEDLDQATWAFQRDTFPGGSADALALATWSDGSWSGVYRTYYSFS
jgi:hypothetical protein